MTQTLSPVELQEFMQAQAVAGQILRLRIPTPTVETAARAVGSNPDQIVKSILFLVEDQPVLAITCGQAYVERRAIARLYGVGRKRVKLASPEVVHQVTGYVVGAMPPFGHRQPLPTLMDVHVLELPEVFAGGGAENALLRLSPQEIVRVTKARLVNLIALPAGDPA